MEKWIRIGNINFNSNNYIVLMNDRNEKFYLKKLEDEKYKFPTVEEIISLYREFHFDDCISNRKFSNGFEPYIKFSKKLVPYALSMSILFSISGCKEETDTVKMLSKNGIEVEQIYEETDFYQVNSIDTKKLNLFSSRISPKIFKTDSFENYCSPCEFKKFIKEDNITWEIIYETINNMDVNSSIKKILIKGIKNLEKNNVNIDLSVLNYNLKMCKFKTFEKNDNSNNLGEFDFYNHEVLIRNDIDINSRIGENIIIHEMIGHGMLCCYDKENGGTVCDVTKLYFAIDQTGNLKGYGSIGISFNEAMADIITSYAMDEKINSNDYAYSTNAYYLLTICESVGCDVFEFANKGIGYLIEKMRQNGVLNPLTTIVAFDDEEIYRRKNMLGDEKNQGMNIIINYFMDQINKKVESDVSEEEIEKWLKDSLCAYKKSIDSIIYQGQDAIINSEKIIIFPSVIEDYLFSELNTYKRKQI